MAKQDLIYCLKNKNDNLIALLANFWDLLN